MLDIISRDKIVALLNDEYKNYISIEVLEKTESTNTLMRSRAEEGAGEGFVIIAGEQTNGRGRMGRTFFSPGDTGIYMSLLLRPEIKPSDAVLITTAAAVSVCEAFEHLGVDNPQIKWVNDIFVNKKKVCGILTEASFNTEKGTLDYAILGIGINMYEPQNGFPEELSTIAGSVFAEKSQDLRNRFIAYFINSFTMYYKELESKKHCKSYAERCFVIGKEINIISGDEIRKAKAIGIDENCGLVVHFDSGETAVVNSGEISVRVNN